MLKKGLAWHYKAYDNRAELDKVTTQILLTDLFEQKSTSVLGRVLKTKTMICKTQAGCESLCANLVFPVL